MVSYEEALEIARTWRPDYNHCIEEKYAHVFTVQPEAMMSVGGDSCVVVLKESGRPVSMAYYMLDYLPKHCADDEERGAIREFDIE